MHYFTNADGLTATCEGDRLIATLEARGFVECLHAAWSAARAEQDRQARMELARQDAEAAVWAAAHDAKESPPPPPAVAAALPKVYASSWKH
jgi:DNA-binding FadR family transcriptional regulator